MVKVKRTKLLKDLPESGRELESWENCTPFH
jgi:hypothetical protein